MGWILFLGGAVVSIFKTILKAFVWICSAFLKAFGFVVTFVFRLGLGWLFLYFAAGGLLYLLGFLGKDSVGLVMFQWGLIPVGLLTLLTVLLKKRKPQSKKIPPQVEIVKEAPQQVVNTNDSVSAGQLLRKYKDVVNNNVLVHEYADRYEKYLILPEGLQLVEIIQKNIEKKTR